MSNSIAVGHVTFTDTATASVYPFTLGKKYTVLGEDDAGWLELKDDTGEVDWRMPRRFTEVTRYDR